MLFSAIFNFCKILKQKSICKVIWGQYYQELLRSSALHCPKPQWSSSLVKCARWPKNGTAYSLCTFLNKCLDEKKGNTLVSLFLYILFAITLLRTYYRVINCIGICIQKGLLSLYESAYCFKRKEKNLLIIVLIVQNPCISSESSYLLDRILHSFYQGYSFP